jgi:signal transduction histidine kinase
LLTPLVQLAYLITGVIAGAVTLILTVVSFAAGALLVPFGLGFVVLNGAARLIRTLAGAERMRATLLLDADLSEAPRGTVEGTWRQRWRQNRRDALLRREVAYCLWLLPATSSATVLVVPLWSAGLVGILSPLYAGFVADGDLLPWWNLPAAAESAAAVAAGSALLIAAVAVTGALARALLRLVVGHLAPRPVDALRARITELTQTRAGVLEATDAERQRIERDLHDGAQQHLVALAMNLGRAKAKFDSDPAAARELVQHAHEEAKESITALRNVVQGLHPPVLTDRGLDAALSTLAARSPVPVRLDVDLPQRFDPTVESVAYFVVSEALTNAARHAGAGQITVTVRGTGSAVTVIIADDGRGGATERPGGGLRGLRDRVAAIDGTVSFSSPLGGGTTITMEVPGARSDR